MLASMTDSDPANTEYIVIRHASDSDAEPKVTSPFEGEWRKRSDLDDERFVEFDDTGGVARGYPTDRIERSSGGDEGQVYEVVTALPEG
jgi:hypothetical protein